MRTGEKGTCGEHPQESSPCFGLARDTVHVSFLLAVRRKSDLRQMVEDPQILGQGSSLRARAILLLFEVKKRIPVHDGFLEIRDPAAVPRRD